MKLDLHDEIARHLYLYGTYDPFVTDAIRSTLSPRDTFVDVGANMGTYSLLAAQIVGPLGKVYAFEPCSRNIRRFKDNVAINALSNIWLLEQAVCDEPGHVDFYDTEDRNNSGTSSLDIREGARKISVPATTLDESLGDLPVDLIKMDIEGCEDRAILGGQGVFSRAVAPKVICEGAISCPAASALRNVGFSITALPRRWYTPPNFIAVKPPATS